MIKGLLSTAESSKSKLVKEKARWYLEEEREMKPYQEKTDVVNLGTGGEKKEVKIGTCVSANV